MEDNLRAQLRIIKVMDLKPNYSELARKYGFDRRTVKKYYAANINRGSHNLLVFR